MKIQDVCTPASHKARKNTWHAHGLRLPCQACPCHALPVCHTALHAMSPFTSISHACHVLMPCPVLSHKPHIHRTNIHTQAAVNAKAPMPCPCPCLTACLMCLGREGEEHVGGKVPTCLHTQSRAARNSHMGKREASSRLLQVQQCKVPVPHRQAEPNSRHRQAVEEGRAKKECATWREKRHYRQVSGYTCWKCIRGE